MPEFDKLLSNTGGLDTQYQKDKLNTTQCGPPALNRVNSARWRRQHITSTGSGKQWEHLEQHQAWLRNTLLRSTRHILFLLLQSCLHKTLNTCCFTLPAGVHFLSMTVFSLRTCWTVTVHHAETQVKWCFTWYTRTVTAQWWICCSYYHWELTQMEYLTFLGFNTGWTEHCQMIYIVWFWAKKLLTSIVQF